MRKICTALGIVAAIAGVAGCGANTANTTTQTDNVQVEIRRMTDGIPHIKANDWTSLGYGFGYAQATDNLCTMADAFLTYRGERSRYLGADEHLPVQSTLGQPKNIDADFFFKLISTDAVVEQYRRAQAPELQQLVHGFAAGYNRYLKEIRSGQWQELHQACRSKPWLTEIADTDLYRRLYAANVAGGYAHFVTAIATATAPVALQTPLVSSLDRDDIQSEVVTQNAAVEAAARQLAQTYFQAGGRAGLGSNGIAFGGDTTADGQALLLGNPHWFWRGPDRFYQAQLTIPGHLNVSGASLLGVPLVMIGFNDAIAWTHTVSSARRFGIFQLTLQAGAPTTYLYDGKPEPMIAVPLKVDVLQKDGSIVTATRTLYRTRFGPLVNLTSLSPAFKWDGKQAFAIRDINAANFRVFQNFLAWNQAHSLDEFMQIQRKLTAVPWVNTIAIGRNDRRVWYADIGAVPNVPDALAAQCATKLGGAFTKGAPGVPFLDGSRSACEWRTEADSAQPGAFPARSMPSLLRTDYVANMNNSYWLANPAEPLTGYARVFGMVPEPLSLRARLGHLLVEQRLAGTDGYVGKRATGDTVRQFALNSRALSAELFKTPALAQLCNGEPVDVAKDMLTGEVFQPPRQVDLAPACRVLRVWDNTGNAGSRGAPLWNAFWARAEKIDGAQLYALPFDPADPVHTPSGLRPDNGLLGQALAAAILDLQKRGIALDAATGDTLFVMVNGERVPLYGGCSEPGYFTSGCAFPQRGAAAPDGSNLLGNSYMQTVHFNATNATTSQTNVDAYTLMSDSESDDPHSPDAGSGTLRYGRKDWLRMPFSNTVSQEQSTEDTLRLDASIERTITRTALP
jgi:acyl-homoserine-lactone acylase